MVIEYDVGSGKDYQAPLVFNSLRISDNVNVNEMNG